VQSFGLNYVAGNNFAVQPQAITTTGAQFQFAFTQAVWASIRINFLASSNPQVQVGFFQVCISYIIQPALTSEPMAALDVPPLPPTSSLPSHPPKTQLSVPS
jgi:hypothetical protein